jgi:KDO2-lipid IV(A) lauroyltransferase
LKSDAKNGVRRKVSSRERLEFWLLWVVVKVIGFVPRGVARWIGSGIGLLAYRVVKKLRGVGLRNLELAYPEKDLGWRERTLAGLYRNLGWLMGEFCQMSGYSAERASEFIEYDGLENFLAARARGKGVLVMTGHLGAWELSSFYHSLMGYPMGLVIRRLDNPLVDEFVNRVRCLHGNRVIHKDDFARGLIAAMRHGETVGILMDTNMTPPQGVFVPFFGREACTASGLAKVALKTDAAVVPGFLLWDGGKKKYRLCFGEQIPLIRTEDAEADVVANTAAFTATIERYVRQYPEQWLWVHRRWKTRPVGEAGIY